MKKVLIPTKLDTIAAKLLNENGSYSVVQEPKTPLADLAAANPDAYALIVRSEKVPAEIMDMMPGLKVVIRAGAGYDNIDCKAARKRGIDVMNTPGANSNAVAEEVIALMLADSRQILRADATTRAGGWEKSKLMGHEITGKTVGIVGLGNIGRLVAKRISGFDCRVLGYDPLVPAERARQMGISVVPLEEIFRESDFVTLHIPENAETRGSINASLFSLMKPGATLINCARSGIIDESALREAKAAKNIRFLNDVYPKDAEGIKSVTDIADIMMPHLGANTYEANETAARRAAQQLIDLDEKGITSFIVNQDVPRGLDPSYCDLACTLAALARGMLGKQYPVTSIETSFYGNLAPFSRWLILSLLNGIWEDIDRSTDYNLALKWLADNGVKYTNREADTSKNYKNSMTIDLCSVNDRNEVRKISVRGTVGEGVKMIARIDEFDRLYWVPSGTALFFEYRDRPGVIGVIGNRLAAAGINIEDMRNPHDPASGKSLAIIAVNKPVSDDLMKSISEEIDAFVAHNITLP